MRGAILNALAALLDVNVDAHTVEAVNKGFPSTPGAYTAYNQGVGYLQRYDIAGNLDNAIAQFSRAVEADSLYALAHAGLCEAVWEKYLQTNQPDLVDRAHRHCEQATHYADDQAAVLVTLGRILIETGEHRKAEVELQRVLYLEPNNAEAFRWLGRVYEDLAQYDQAEEAYQHAISLRPDLWIYYNELGVFLDDTGRSEEALEQFEKVSRLTPDNYLAFNSLGVCKQNLNDVADAERLFRHAIDLQPNEIAYRNLGQLFFRQNQYGRAVEALEQARALNENDWITWSFLGHAYYWADDTTQARAAWRRVIELAGAKYEVNQRDNNVLVLLTDAYMALGDYERGDSYLNLLQSLPDDVNYIGFYLGRMYAMRQQHNVALNHLDRALQAGFDPVVIDQDPWLEDLRADPQYHTLRQRFLASPR